MRTLHSFSNHDDVFKREQEQNDETKPRPSLPDDVIVVTQVELLGVFAGVVDNAHSSHEVHHLFPSCVVQVVATLVSSVSVDPLQPQLAARSRFIRHDGKTPRTKKNKRLLRKHRNSPNRVVTVCY